MVKVEKEWVVKNLEKTLKGPNFLIFTGYQGLKVEEFTELRKNLAKVNSSLHVVKNTLAKLSAKKVKREELLPFFKGPVTIASSNKDNISLAKILIDFAKSHPFLVIKGGVWSERLLGVKDIDSLAKLPSREVLLAQLKNGFLAPLNGLVFSLKGLMQNLIGILKNIEKQET